MITTVGWREVGQFMFFEKIVGEWVVGNYWLGGTEWLGIYWLRECGVKKMGYRV